MNRAVAMIGAGYTSLTRVPGASEVELAVHACRRAAADAGLDVSAIDGLNVQVHHDPPPDTDRIVEQLALGDLRWVRDGGLGTASLGRAADAIASGQASVVAVVKIMNTVAPVHPPPIAADGGVDGPAQFEVPYGLGYTMQRVALFKRRWMHDRGITDEQVGALCVTQRRHALLNPHAIFDREIGLDDYLASRWVTEPLRLLDCDYPVNGSFAYLLADAEVAQRLDGGAAYLKGWAVDEQPRVAQHLWPDIDGVAPCALAAYERSGLGPEDMDVWMLYDGFSILALAWMEALGLVEPGESGRYVADGARISIEGEHPVNTHGGQLSEGRMHGAGHLLEAFQQVRGTAGPRQARRAEHVVVSSAYPQHGGVAILGRRP